MDSSIQRHHKEQKFRLDRLVLFALVIADLSLIFDCIHDAPACEREDDYFFCIFRAFSDMTCSMFDEIERVRMRSSRFCSTLRFSSIGRPP